MRVGALEGKAADAGRGLPSREGRAAELAGEMHRCAGYPRVPGAEGSRHVGVDRCQVCDARCHALPHPASTNMKPHHCTVTQCCTQMVV